MVLQLVKDPSGETLNCIPYIDINLHNKNKPLFICTINLIIDAILCHYKGIDS